MPSSEDKLFIFQRAKSVLLRILPWEFRGWTISLPLYIHLLMHLLLFFHVPLWNIYIFIYGSSHRQVFVRNVGVNLLYNKVRHFKRLKSSAAHTERFQTMLSSRGLMGFMKRTTLEQKNKFTSRHYYRAITKIKPFSTRLKQLEMRHQGFILRGNSESLWTL